jgi:hypothetical protein
MWYSHFQTLTRFLGSFEKTAMAVRTILEVNKWSRVSIIWEMHADIVWRYTANAMKAVLEESNNYTIADFIQLGIGSVLTEEQAIARASVVSRSKHIICKFRNWEGIEHFHCSIYSIMLFLLINWFIKRVHKLPGLKIGEPR